MQVLWGVISPCAMQQMCTLLLRDVEAAVNRSLDMKPVAKLAGLGCSGKYPGNVWKELKRCLPEPKIPIHYEFLPLHSLQLGNFWRTTLHRVFRFRVSLSLHPSL